MLETNCWKYSWLFRHPWAAHLEMSDELFVWSISDVECVNPFDAETGPCVCPTKEIPIEFQIRLEYICLYLPSHVSDHKKFCTFQDSCLGMYKISLWLVQFSLDYSEDKFHRIPNSIELSLVGRAPGQYYCCWCPGQLHRQDYRQDISR